MNFDIILVLATHQLKHHKINYTVIPALKSFPLILTLT